MFTGIVEEVGTIIEVGQRRSGVRLGISAGLVASDAAVGSSVAVNGCCLTVVDFAAAWLAVEVVPETLKRTTIVGFRTGSRVNLERPLSANGRFGGHVVQGHIDGVAHVASREGLEDGSSIIGFAVPSGQLPYLVEKGSVAVDGVSLTVAGLVPGGFEVAVIPHTSDVTTFGLYEVGTAVNIEVDILAKYVEGLITEGCRPWLEGVEK